MNEQTTAAHATAAHATTSTRDELHAAPSEDPVLALTRRHAFLVDSVNSGTGLSDDEVDAACAEICGIEGRLGEMVPVSLEGAAAMLDVMLSYDYDFGNGNSDIAISRSIQAWFATQRTANGKALQSQALPSFAFDPKEIFASERLRWSAIVNVEIRGTREPA